MSDLIPVDVWNAIDKVLLTVPFDQKCRCGTCMAMRDLQQAARVNTACLHPIRTVTTAERNKWKCLDCGTILDDRVTVKPMSNIGAPP